MLNSTNPDLLDAIEAIEDGALDVAGGFLLTAVEETGDPGIKALENEVHRLYREMLKKSVRKSYLGWSNAETFYIDRWLNESGPHGPMNDIADSAADPDQAARMLQTWIEGMIPSVAGTPFESLIDHILGSVDYKEIVEHLLYGTD